MKFSEHVVYTFVVNLFVINEYAVLQNVILFGHYIFLAPSIRFSLKNAEKADLIIDVEIILSNILFVEIS